MPIEVRAAPANGLESGSRRLVAAPVMGFTGRGLRAADFALRRQGVTKSRVAKVTIFVVD